MMILDIFWLCFTNWIYYIRFGKCCWYISIIRSCLCYACWSILTSVTKLQTKSNLIKMSDKNISIQRKVLFLYAFRMLMMHCYFNKVQCTYVKNNTNFSWMHPLLESAIIKPYLSKLSLLCNLEKKIDCKYFPIAYGAIKSMEMF